MSADAGPFSAVSMTERRQSTGLAAESPEVGMAFQEMYSHWVFVTSVNEHVVQVVRGGGHPSWFPECGRLENIPRAKFPEAVQFEYLADRRYDVDGWGARAEGIKVEELERRVAAGTRGGAS